MKVTHVNTVKFEDEIHSNYDHKKYIVRDKKGKFKGFIYEHGGEYLTEFTADYYPTLESAAEAVATR